MEKTISDYYAEYVRFPHKEYTRDGIRYCRMICALPYQLQGQNCLSITVPNILVQNKCLPLPVVTEHGEHLLLDTTVQCCFRGEIPKWYYETTTFLVKVPTIAGQYLRCL